MSVNKDRRKWLGLVTAAFAAVALPSLASACDETKQSTHTVEIKGSQFQVALLQVKLGDTITWTNHDIVPHTATAKDDSWDTGLIAQGESKSVVVTTNMVLDYYCRFHPMMIAKIEIVDSIAHM